MNKRRGFSCFSTSWLLLHQQPPCGVAPHVVLPHGEALTLKGTVLPTISRRIMHKHDMVNPFCRMGVATCNPPPPKVSFLSVMCALPVSPPKGTYQQPVRLGQVASGMEYSPNTPVGQCTIDACTSLPLGYHIAVLRMLLKCLHTPGLLFT